MWPRDAIPALGEDSGGTRSPGPGVPDSTRVRHTGDGGTSEGAQQGGRMLIASSLVDAAPGKTPEGIHPFACEHAREGPTRTCAAGNGFAPSCRDEHSVSAVQSAA